MVRVRKWLQQIFSSESWILDHLAKENILSELDPSEVTANLTVDKLGKKFVADISQTPKRMIHIYSTSRREFKIDRQPLWLRLTLRACPRHRRYVAVAHVPDPMMQVVHDHVTGRHKAEANDGMICAMDLLDPGNPTFDPDFVCPPHMKQYFGTSIGCNLFAQGLFLSLHSPPLRAEVRAAELRKEKHYREVIALADKARDRDLEEFIRSSWEIRLALDYFGLERRYHDPKIEMRRATRFERGVLTIVLPLKAWSARGSAFLKRWFKR